MTARPYAPPRARAIAPGQISMQSARVSAPEISVVLPYRDAAPTLAEAITSILAERDVDLELIAVDDGSRDDGPALVESLAAGDPRVRSIRAAPRGIVAALSRGVEAARAPFIARMDADDVSLPGRLARQVAALRADGSLGAVGCLVQAFPEEIVEEGLARYVAWQNQLLTPEEHAREIFVESPLCHPSVMMRRDAVRAVGGYREGLFPEDYDLWLRLVEAGWALAKIPALGLLWRHSADRLTFRDPRCSIDAFRRCKAPFLAARVRREERPLSIWGAGKEGRRLARDLEPHDVRPARFIDIDPKKIGRTARGCPIEAPSALDHRREFVVAAVASRGARDLIRDALAREGFVEGRDFVCAA
jgi:glycosyltransferase involved in cell wall biosynthesis